MCQGGSGGFKAEERQPTASEQIFFQQNKHVAGMASEDDRVVMNPHSSLSDTEKAAVRENETARIYMRRNMPATFALTEEQKSKFSKYSKNEQDIKDTIAARILSGDPSAGAPTDEQKRFVDDLRLKMRGR